MKATNRQAGNALGNENTIPNTVAVNHSHMAQVDNPKNQREP
jgi:hypothetical protein